MTDFCRSENVRLHIIYRTQMSRVLQITSNVFARNNLKRNDLPQYLLLLSTEWRPRAGFTFLDPDNPRNVFGPFVSFY